MLKGKGAKALRVVRSFFPYIQNVVDAKDSIQVEVTPEDEKTSNRKDHNGCAMAVACKRKYNATGVIVSTSVAYLIHGLTATRYELPQSVIREVVSFDRSGIFEPGTYQLRKPANCRKLGIKHKHKKKHASGTDKKNMPFRHYTGGVRAVLGSKELG